MDERGLSFEDLKLDGEGTFCLKVSRDFRLKISSWMERGLPSSWMRGDFRLKISRLMQRGLSFEDLKLDERGLSFEDLKLDERGLSFEDLKLDGEGAFV